MNSSIVIVDSKNRKHYISDAHLNYAYSLLLKAGYSIGEANDLALQWLNSRAQISAVDERDLLYRSHPFTSEDDLCGAINTRLHSKGLLHANMFAQFE